MKNESRIEELLAESLKSQDRQAELSGKHSKIIERQSEILISNSAKLDDVVGAVQEMTKVMETVIQKFDKIDNHEQRISSIERKLSK